MTNSLDRSAQPPSPDRKPNSALSQWRSQKADDPGWLWWLITGSSIAAHLLLLSLALPFSSSLSPQSSASSNRNPTPIDLIELPPNQPPTTSPPPSTQPTAAVPTIPPVVNPPAPLPTAPTAPPAPTAGDIAFAPAPAPAPIPPTPISPAPFSPAPLPNPSTIAPSPPTLPPAIPPSATTAPSPTPAIPTSPSTERESSQSPLSSVPPVSPTDPSIATLPIDVAVPDVSQRVEIPPESAAPSGQIETPQQIVPVRLTASLTTTEPDPAATTETETIAQPLQETETFTNDPTRSPCLITPDVIPYLSKTVAVQVTTNEAGQATDASVRQSSGSPVYDNLAVCMVRQWQFEPATDQGVPVVSDALVVAVRIE